MAMDTYKEEIGLKLKALRNSKGFSLGKASAMTGGIISAGRLGNYETGNRMPSLEVIELLSDTYEVSPSEILPNKFLNKIQRQASIDINIMEEAISELLPIITHLKISDYKKAHLIYLYYNHRLSGTVTREIIDSMIRLATS